MEGSIAGVVRKPAVEHCFECSRLEKALLARAYEEVVPATRRRVGQQVAEMQTRLRRHIPAERMHTLAKGG